MDAPLLDGGGDYLPVKSLSEARTIFWAESLKMWRIAAPVAFTIICQYGTNSFTSIFVGHIGDIELSAVTISLSVIGTFSFGFMVDSLFDVHCNIDGLMMILVFGVTRQLGMGSALETLCGQAFGAGQVHMLGLYMQRSWIILLVTSVALLPIYIFAAPILELFGQEHEISEMAGKFTIQVIPQLFSLAINFPTQKFLQAQCKVGALAWIGFVGLVLHVGLLWGFVTWLGMGVDGAAVAYNITSWGIALAQVGYVMCCCKDGWVGFSSAAFSDIWPFVQLSLSSAVMLCLEIWYMMSIIILTGHLDNAVVAVGSLSICMNFNGWEAMLFIGINAAISVRVSNELGLGHPRAAKYSVYVTVFQSLLIGLLCMVVIMMTKSYFAIIFTSSKKLQEATSGLAYLLGATMVLNSVQPVISGVAVGGGWQALVAYINLGSYYIFGLPLGFFLGYSMKLRVEGLWGGMICGTALQTLLLLLVLYKTNWNKEVEQTWERVRRWGGKENVDRAEDRI
ncbi:hypothetical protein SAY87_024294 [Trapa incisa]|uniref:Protein DETOXIFICATION n=1 Tax=Trapa incisa TaxID=236973 RepID=A0AAN7J8K4_9MYRT|nr:hypothetical protein SAY87_024294 [Trapa incisa]